MLLLSHEQEKKASKTFAAQAPKNGNKDTNFSLSLLFFTWWITNNKTDEWTFEEHKKKQWKTEISTMRILFPMKFYIIYFNTSICSDSISNTRTTVRVYKYPYQSTIKQ